jgi:hypothetical protein
VPAKGVPVFETSTTLPTETFARAGGVRLRRPEIRSVPRLAFDGRLKGQRADFVPRTTLIVPMFHRPPQVPPSGDGVLVRVIDIASDPLVAIERNRAER